MCNDVEINVGSFNAVDYSKYGSEPTIYAKVMIPTRLVTPGHQDQMTRGQLAEQMILALEGGLADFRQYLNELRRDVGMAPIDLNFDYKQHKVNE